MAMKPTSCCLCFSIPSVYYHLQGAADVPTHQTPCSGIWNPALAPVSTSIRVLPAPGELKGQQSFSHSLSGIRGHLPLVNYTGPVQFSDFWQNMNEYIQAYYTCYLCSLHGHCILYVVDDLKINPQNILYNLRILHENCIPQYTWPSIFLSLWRNIPVLIRLTI